MKLTKLSLVAVVFIGSSLFAIENTKISGDARVYYGTKDSNSAGAPDMFDKESSYFDFAARVDVTTDLVSNVSAGIGLQVVSTLDAENSFAEQAWSGSHVQDGSNTEESIWIDEVWLAGTALDTTLKVGRQVLDTPMVFSETWGVDKNTFEAGLLTNKTITDTDLIFAYIHNSNGSAQDTDTRGVASQAGYVSVDGDFHRMGDDGVFIFGVKSKSIESLTLQAWYYDETDISETFWLQADLSSDEILAGVQLLNKELDSNSDDTTAYSVMLGYKIKDMATVKVAYSDVDDGATDIANLATGAGNGGQSKLYTELWWNYGQVSLAGAKAIAISAEANMLSADWFLGLYNVEVNPDAAVDTEITEVTLAVSKSFGELDTSLAIIYADSEDNITPTNDIKSTDIQLYLTYNF